MKARLFVFFGSILIFLTGCNLTGTSNYTPSFSISASHINKTDTIRMYVIDNAGTLGMDTLYMGDTIVFKTFLNGFANNLTSFNVLQNDTTDAKIIYPSASSMDSIVSLNQSNIPIGKFIFLPKQNFVYFPLRYVPKKITNNASVQFSLTSDATFNTGFGNNSVAYKIIIPVKAAPVSTQ